MQPGTDSVSSTANGAARTRTIRRRGRRRDAADLDRRRGTRKVRTLTVKARAEDLSFYYGEPRALKNLNIEIRERRVTALIGPSGCGKTTFLRCFNRMHDLTPATRYEGRIMLYPD